MDRDEAIARIRKALKQRSGKAWSVTGGRGTAWGWIRIDAPPARRIYNHAGALLPTGQRECGYMSLEDRQELARLLGKDGAVLSQGDNIPAGGDYYEEYLARAEGRPIEKFGHQYWD
jgi:hypothetical protein